MANPSIYTVGGTVQAGGGIYVPRHADEELLGLCRQSVFAYILTSRQMGKSSLMVQTAERLADEDIYSVIIDLTQLGVKVTAEQWYLGLLSIIEEALMLDTDVVSWWQSRNHLGFTQRLIQFFQEVLLVEVTSPIVFFVDEIDTTLSLDFTDDFFAAIRYLYVARAQDAKFKRLSFVLIGVATPGDLIRDPKRTPFNIGQRLDLTDFSFEEAMPLAEGLGVPGEPGQQLLKWVLSWTGGHPYLTQRLCSVISEHKQDIWSSTALEQVVSTTFFGVRSQQDNNLQFVRDMLTKRAPNQDQVLSVYREICLGRRSVFDEEQSIIKSHLKLSGVVRREGNVLQVRNRIYQEVFNVDWVENVLAQQRPYSQALMAWLEKNREDESPLLRGKYLQDALAWAKGKSLGDDDYQFLAASQELDKREIQFALAETEKKAQQIVADAERKAKRTNRISFGLLAVAIVGAIGTVGAGLYAQKLLKDAQTFTKLEQSANRALRLFDTYEREGLLAAMETGQDLQSMVKDDRPGEYPAASPILALQTILGSIKERNQLKGHTNSVKSARFSGDGKRILTASWDNTARIWDSSGKQLAVFKGHTDAVNSARFSSDGKRILTASEDNTARLWDNSGNQLAVLKGHTSRVNSARFSGDGKRILTASEDNTARLWDRFGNQLAVLKGHTSAVNSARFSSDGKRILTASEDNTARLWDRFGNQLAVLKGHTFKVVSARFSSDGKRILTASEDNTARLWDNSGKQLAVLKGHTDAVNSARFSGDGKRILTASEDNTARLWDNSGKQLDVLKGHISWVNNARFSGDGKRILTASWDNTARLWDNSGKQLAVLKGHTSAVNSARFSGDGKRILTASEDSTARIWDNSGKQLAVLKGHTSAVNSARFSGDGKRILTASEDNTARLWDNSGKQLAVLKGHTSKVVSARFSGDGKRTLTASWDNTARLWDNSGKQLAVLKGHISKVVSARFSGDGKRILTASWDNTARLWDNSGNQLAVLQGHTSKVVSARFSGDGKRILTASKDNTARLWDNFGNQLAVLQGHTSAVNNARFSGDGKRILTASKDNTARLWLVEELDDLLGRGCSWLDDYLVTHAQDLRKLKVCQTPSRLQAAAPFLVKAGEKSAKAGDVEEAVATFKTALKWNPQLKFDSQQKAQQLAKQGKAKRLISEGSRLVTQKKIKEAIAAYKQAQKLDPQVKIDADAWNNLCWDGSLHESAKKVMFACENAVKLAPNGYTHGSRGLAKALTGDVEGAIEDFEAHIDEVSPNWKAERQRWVKALQEGKNPFTKEELEKLRSE